MVNMKKPIYGCSRCQKTLLRKWNAERHGSSVHKGLSTIGAQLGSEAKTANSFRSHNNPTVRYSSVSKAKKSNISGSLKNKRVCQSHYGY